MQYALGEGLDDAMVDEQTQLNRCSLAHHEDEIIRPVQIVPGKQPRAARAKAQRESLSGRALAWQASTGSQSKAQES